MLTKRLKRKSKFADKVSTAITYLRNMRGLDYKSIAHVMKNDPTTVYMWEKKIRTPRQTTIEYMETHLGVKIL